MPWPGVQGNRIINPLKKKRKKPTETEWRGSMDIRTELALIPDPRIDRCKKHNLVDMLLLCSIAMVCGAESVEDIAFFGETHEAWLKKHLALPNGTPSADAILRALGRIDHQKFEPCFLSWTRGYFKERASAGSVVAIDGKTARGSASEERKAIPIVSAWADELGLVLGQAQTEEQSNEITAMPALLEALDVSGCIVTIDAMGCQKTIAQSIVAKHGGYALALKENHPEAYAEARELFEAIDESPPVLFLPIRKQPRIRGG
jgi:predicted transposase YbfD/YdcC